MSRELVIYGSYTEYKSSKYYAKATYINHIEQLFGHKDTVLHLRGRYWLNPITNRMRELKLYCDTHNIRIT